MDLSRVIRIIDAISIAFSLLGGLLVRFDRRGPPNLDGFPKGESGDVLHSQDPPTRGVENEKPEDEVQGEFNFGNDSNESSPN
jgi:hypothetical protein